MADNVPVTPGSGANIATDDVGGVHYQEIKIALGLADAVDTLLDSGQQTMANSLPVVIASDQTALSVTANAGTNLNTSGLALEAGGNLAAAAASLSVVDDWDETDRAKVNIIVGQAGVQGGSGVVGATTQRVVLATDVGLPAGTNTIGSVEVDGTDLSNGQVTVDTTVGGVTILTASAGRQGVVIANQGSVACYVGTGSVTTGNGFLLNAGESVAIPTDAAVKGITASGSTTVGYLALA